MGLVQYDSSEDEEDEQIEVQPKTQAQKPATDNVVRLADENGIPSHPTPSASVPTATQNQGDELPENSQPSQPTNVTPQPEPSSATGPVLGPALGPSRPPPTYPESDPNASVHSLQEEVDMSFLEDATTTPSDPPKSPYTAQRTLLRDLTLPAIDISTLSIPPSPPSSPSSSSHLPQLNAKFDNFLLLKRTQGVHFNARLASSSMMRNPSLTDKMLAFVGVETEFLGPGDVQATEQYATTLPADLWDPGAFPDWAYKGVLRKTQERGTKERERVRGEPVEFVASSSSSAGGGVGGGSRAGTPAVSASGAASNSGVGKRKSRFDV